MTIEEIRSLNIEGVEQRIAQIRQEMDAPNADIDALNKEVDALEARRKELREQAEARSRLAARVAGGEGVVIRSLNQMNTNSTDETTYTAASPEYKRAWLKNLAVRDGRKIFGEPTQEEQRAFMFATTQQGLSPLVPTDIQNRIVELVESDSPMLDDADVSAMTRGFGVPRHKSIDAGDAKGVSEGTANEDEQDTFDLVTLEGIEIKKHVVITRKMEFQSIDAFEDWLVTHLAARIRVAKEKVILARLTGVAPDGGNVISNAGIYAGNIVSGKAYDDEAIREAFSKIKPAGPKVVYANNATIWNKFAGMETTKGDKLFVPNSMVDPIVQGRMYGAEVKVDSNLADNVAFFGVKGKIKANNFDALFIHSAIEPKTMNTIITAYALFDAALEEPEAFVRVTFTAE